MRSDCPVCSGRVIEPGEMNVILCVICGARHVIEPHSGRVVSQLSGPTDSLDEGDPIQPCLIADPTMSDRRSNPV
jgi:hypothetical protein